LSSLHVTATTCSTSCAEWSCNQEGIRSLTLKISDWLEHWNFRHSTGLVTNMSWSLCLGSRSRPSCSLGVASADRCLQTGTCRLCQYARYNSLLNGIMRCSIIFPSISAAACIIIYFLTLSWRPIAPIRSYLVTRFDMTCPLTNPFPVARPAISTEATPSEHEGRERDPKHRDHDILVTSPVECRKFQCSNNQKFSKSGS